MAARNAREMEKETLTFDNLRRVLDDFTRDVGQAYQKRIREKDKVASGKLLESAGSGHIVVQGSHYEVIFDLEDYYYYIERGSKGAISSEPGALGKVHWTPVQALLQWIQIKPTLPKPSTLKDQLSMAFAVRQKIHDFGTKPAPMLTESVEECYARYEPLIYEALYEDTKEFANGLMIDVFQGFTK